MINAIFAMDLNYGLGNKGTLPWPRNKEDLSFFAETTKNHIVVMGRNTWDDPKMPKPLKDRVNVIVSSKPVFHPSVVTTDFSHLRDKISRLQEEFPEKEVFIIGGKTLLTSCKGWFDRIYVTHIKGNYWADTRFDSNRSGTKNEYDEFVIGYETRTVIPKETCTIEILHDKLKPVIW